MAKDYYDILGISRGASKQEVETAYHALAHRFYSDKVEGGEEKLMEIAEAYRVLSDDGSRAYYDKNGVPKPSSFDNQQGTQRPPHRLVKAALSGVVLGAILWIFLLTRAPYLLTNTPFAMPTGSSGGTAIASTTPQQAGNISQSQSVMLQQGTEAPAPDNIPSPQSTPAKTLPQIIAQWSPSVALVVCTFSNGAVDWGSGLLYHPNNTSIEVITNKHVLTDETTYLAATSCYVEIPGDGNKYYAYNATEAVNGDPIEDPIEASANYDLGDIIITNGDSYFNNVANENLPICQQQEQTGDSIVVLGYPDYAGQFTQPTATQGIISGYAAPYYTTSAQIESGNSGGVAIDIADDCYVGIPSAVETGNYGNLGRILSADIPFQLPY